nr:unnamed protein product [Haemonchus contortus]
MRYISLSTSSDEVEREQFLGEDHQEPIFERLLRRKNIRVAFVACIVFIILILAINNFGTVAQEQEDDVIEEQEDHDVTEPIHFEPLSELKIAKAAKSYRMQEKLIKNISSLLENIEEIQRMNSDVLPNRLFAGLSAAQMCQPHRNQCVQPFAKIRPLIVVGTNRFFE